MSFEIPAADLSNLLRNPSPCCPGCGASVITAKNTDSVVYMIDPTPKANGRAVVTSPGQMKFMPLTRNEGQPNPNPSGTVRRDLHFCSGTNGFASVCRKQQKINDMDL